MASKAGAGWNLAAVAAAMSAAAIDPGRWGRAMDVISEQTGSVGAVLLPVDGLIPHSILSHSIAGLSEAYLRDGWYETDLRFRGVSRLRSHGVFDERHYTSEEEMRRHPYFQELLGRFDLRWSAMVKMQAGEDLWTVAIQRSNAQGAFSSTELASLQQLSRHLSTVGAAAKALGFARVDAALQAFEASGTPVMLLDRQARVFRMNPAAERLVDADLQLVKGRLRPRQKDSARKLDNALQKILWDMDDQVPLGGPVVIPREGRAPLLAFASRIPSLTADALAPCQVILVFQDPEQRALPSVATLRECFGLTAAEARLVVHIASGMTLDDVAARTSVSKLTVRNQLSAAMKKVGVRRQSELMTTVAALAPRFKLDLKPKI
jgi:DNA-binding CsgD family transcriptional regulator/PAS domain-containing protein